MIFPLISYIFINCRLVTVGVGEGNSEMSREEYNPCETYPKDLIQIM